MPRTPRKRGMRRFAVARATEASRRGSVLFGRSSVSDGAAADGSPPPRRRRAAADFRRRCRPFSQRAPTPRPRSTPPVAAATTARSTRRSNRKSVTVTVPEETPSRAGTFTSEEAVGGEASPADGEWQPRKRAASRLSRRVSTLAGNRRMSTLPSGAPSPPGARRPRRRSVRRGWSAAERGGGRAGGGGGGADAGGDVAGRAHVARRVESTPSSTTTSSTLRRCASCAAGSDGIKGCACKCRSFWDIAETQTFRMDCTSYMDYHLSVFHWLMAQEEEEALGGVRRRGVGERRRGLEQRPAGAVVR